MRSYKTELSVWKDDVGKINNIHNEGVLKLLEFQVLLMTLRYVN